MKSDFVRAFCGVTFLLGATTPCIAQQSGTGQSKVVVRSTLVMVPVLATTTEGNVVFDLTADDFLLTDNGVPQEVSIEQDTDSQPLALAIVVETGAAGASHLIDYQELDSILDALIGNVEHQVAVISFDSSPHVIVPFTSRTEDASHGLANLSEGGQGAAILDAVGFAVGQLRPLATGVQSCCSAKRLTKVVGQV